MSWILKGAQQPAVNARCDLILHTCLERGFALSVLPRLPPSPLSSLFWAHVQQLQLIQPLPVLHAAELRPFLDPLAMEITGELLLLSH